MSSRTHVSDSLAGSSACESTKSEPLPVLGANGVGEVDKELFVAEFVVNALFSDKKRKLAQMVEEQVQTATKKRVKALDCGCGCGAVACTKKTSLREKYLKHLAHKLWPRLEKELVRELAQSLLQSRRSNAWLANELATIAHENSVLKARIAIVASIF